MLKKGTIKKIVLLGTSFGLTLSGTIVQISQRERISAGRGKGQSFRFESIDDVEKIIDSIPNSNVYQLLSSNDEEIRKTFDLGENFHTLTLNNKLKRTYETSTEYRKLSNSGEQYVNPNYEGKEYNITDFAHDYYAFQNWRYLYSQNEIWNIHYVTETYNNKLLSYYTDKGLLLEFDIVHEMSYRDSNTLREHGIFDGIDNSEDQQAYKTVSTEDIEYKLETILKGDIYITDGTAFLKYDRYENNYKYNNLVYKHRGMSNEYTEYPREFDDAFYHYFPDARPSEQKIIKDAMDKSIKKNYGKYFDLRFTADEVKMPKMPSSEEEMEKMSDKEIKNLMSSYALAMITPTLLSYCDSTIAEMIQIGNIPMDQLHLNLDYYSQKDEEGNLLNTKKDGRVYKLGEENRKEFFGGYLENTGVLPKGKYAQLCQEQLLRDVEYQFEHSGLTSFYEEIENSNDLVAKTAMENYKNLLESLEPEDHESRRQLDEMFFNQVLEFAQRTRKTLYNPGRTESAKAFFSLLDDTAPTFYVDFESDRYRKLDGSYQTAKYEDTFTIMDVDNTVIKAPKKIRKTVYDLYKDAMDEYANTMYEQYKK